MAFVSWTRLFLHPKKTHRVNERCGNMTSQDLDMKDSPRDTKKLPKQVSSVYKTNTSNPLKPRDTTLPTALDKKTLVWAIRSLESGILPDFQWAVRQLLKASVSSSSLLTRPEAYGLLDTLMSQTNTLLAHFDPLYASSNTTHLGHPTSTDGMEAAFSSRHNQLVNFDGTIVKQEPEPPSLASESTISHVNDDFEDRKQRVKSSFDSTLPHIHRSGEVCKRCIQMREEKHAMNAAKAQQKNLGEKLPAKPTQLIAPDDSLEHDPFWRIEGERPHYRNGITDEANDAMAFMTHLSQYQRIAYMLLIQPSENSLLNTLPHLSHVVTECFCDIVTLLRNWCQRRDEMPFIMKHSQTLELILNLITVLDPGRMPLAHLSSIQHLLSPSILHNDSHFSLVWLELHASVYDIIPMLPPMLQLSPPCFASPLMACDFILSIQRSMCYFADTQAWDLVMQCLSMLTQLCTSKSNVCVLVHDITPGFVDKLVQLLIHSKFQVVERVVEWLSIYSDLCSEILDMLALHADAVSFLVRIALLKGKETTITSRRALICLSNLASHRSGMMKLEIWIHEIMTLATTPNPQSDSAASVVQEFFNTQH